MKKRGSMSYFLIIVVVAAFASVVFYGIDSYTGLVVYSKCIDYDNGFDYSIKSNITYTKPNGIVYSKKDECRDYIKLKEWGCENNQPKFELVQCERSCFDGACKPCLEEGCLYKGRCVKEGSRHAGSDFKKYCDGSELLDQKRNGASCVMDYECISYNCYDGVCLYN
jgi:hypothetical protein